MISVVAVKHSVGLQLHWLYCIICTAIVPYEYVCPLFQSICLVCREGWLSAESRRELREFNALFGLHLTVKMICMHGGLPVQAAHNIGDVCSIVSL
jgi:hypothetical protein